MLGGFHAIVWFLTPTIAAIISATPFLIMLAKVKKPFAVLISGVVIALLYLITGQFSIFVPITFILAGIIGEIIRYISKYKSFKADSMAYAFISLGIVASPLPLWIDSEAFIKKITDFGMPKSYINTCMTLTSPKMLVIIIIATIVSAFVGAIIARILFRKHFKKAGVIK